MAFLCMLPNIFKVNEMSNRSFCPIEWYLNDQLLETVN